MNAQSFFIKDGLFYIIKYIYITIICAKCEYQLPINIIQKKDGIIHNTQITVILHSHEPFNTLTRAIRKELYLNNINIIDDNTYTHLLHTTSNKYTLCLNILSILEKRVVVSVFQDGTESEYKLFLEVHAKYCNAKNTKNYHPIHVRVQRTLIQDPYGALSNLVQENEILDLMRIDAAQQLIQKFLIQLKINASLNNYK